MVQLAKQGEELVRELPKALLNWYDFKPGSKILYVGTKDSYSEVLVKYADRMVYTDCVQLKDVCWQKEFERYFNYVVCVEVLEKERNPQECFEAIRKLLVQDGIFLAGMNNRFGIRYFCGDRDPYTWRSFDGIEDYKRAYVKKEDIFQGRMYCKAELKQMLVEAGWKEENFQFFSILPDLWNSSLLYSEDCIPNEDLGTRLTPAYYYPDTVFLEEEGLYQSLIKNGMFHSMVNAYLIECSMNGRLTDVRHVTGSMDRGREGALLTVIHKSGIVEKKAAYPEGQKRLEQLIEHGNELKARGLSVVEAQIVDKVYRMPYIDAEIGQMYLKKLLCTNQKKFLEELDHFHNLILQSSEIAVPDKGDGEGAILEKCYIEMMPLNSFYVNGEFMFFDQEICEYNYPANVLIFRMISSLYAGNAGLHKLLPSQVLYERYGLAKNLKRWAELDRKYLDRLLNRKQLQVYHEKCRRNPETVNENRQRMNYSETEYKRLFGDIFKGIGACKIILFGSGVFAKRFLGMYVGIYSIYAVIDNNEQRWGQEIKGIKIQSPEILKQMSQMEYKIIICIKNFLSVMKQLDAMNIKNYCIFDPGKSYPQWKPDKLLKKEENRDSKLKRYHIGYVAGVFDLFHVGHVNVLRKAKDMCDYLIVGVVPDKAVYCQKGKYPVIPCEDRIEMLKSCRYVDQVQKLPEDYAGIRDAYKLFQFDCMFSGDDHIADIGWALDKEFLKKNGADIVFFDYTEKVSSTKLREQLKHDNIS